MEWINKKTILIVGLGLMGGSYAMALKRLGYTVTAIDTDEDSIDYAVNNSIIVSECHSPSAAQALQAKAVPRQNTA